MPAIILAASRPRRAMRERAMTGSPDMPDRRENAGGTPQIGPRYPYPNQFEPGPTRPVTHRLRATRWPTTAGGTQEWARYCLAGAGRRRPSQRRNGLRPHRFGSCRGHLRFPRACARQAWHRRQRRGRDRRDRAGRLGSRRRLGVHRDLDDGLEGRPRRRLHRLHPEGRLQPRLAAAVRRPVPAKRARPVERDVDSGATR